MPNEVAQLPIPDRLEPKRTKRSLGTCVRMYFYPLYNASASTFRDLLRSVGNKDSKNGNRLFDRHVAVGMIKKAAIEAKDSSTAEAVDGDIYKIIVDIMRSNNLGLKLRRFEYKRLAHMPQAAMPQAAAEESAVPAE
jgi:hypothetical protein